ncbi:MAG: hypothetical protein F4051_00170 [Boseongicola sp. SB0670_bin_30]|nr:hypothetical protein [Boseongicola sp. SB0670_bin_30]
MKQQISAEVSGTPPNGSPAEDSGSAGLSEPIAIVGMACRFPQADGLEAFRRLLDGGVNAVTEGVPGSGVVR